MGGHLATLDSLTLEGTDAPLAVCGQDGTLRAATPAARAMLQRMRAGGTGEDPSRWRLPGDFWDTLQAVEPGRAIEWRSPAEPMGVVGCTRYRYLDGYLLLIKELSVQRAATAGRMHGQRLEAIGRLVASIAHELRNSVASIVYSADLLRLEGLPAEDRRETVDGILVASQRLQGTVAGLLDFARLGPAVSVPVSLRQVLTRAQGVLRSQYNATSHRLEVTIAREAEWVRGNSLVVEQVFINLLMNAAQAGSERSGRVEVRAELAASDLRPPDRYVRVSVSDDGPGIPQGLRDTVFEPFFTTRPEGTGLGLSNAREAVEALGGSLHLEESAVGASFVFYLPTTGQPLPTSAYPARPARRP